MRQQANVERVICDVCKTKESYPWNACLRCGKDICYDCCELHGKRYSHGVHSGGSGDGVYCNDCDAALTQAANDPMHNAYRAIAALRNESEGYYADFAKRRKAAEDALQKLQGRP